MRVRTIARITLAVLYALAGVAHLTRPAGFVAITPDWVPAPALVVALTGVAELAGAIGLMIQPLRRAAGVGLALYALCVWPANINHALNDIALGGVHLSWWYHGPRLVLQPIIIWWALWAGAVIDWPFRRR
ncbi:DoxX family membrane protein [Sphingobium sp. WCS2017Hpa-17]|uniref:DoxX family protein n=1 Tax=Sphingobium sp. WCS2017Hpa-17 TaxID=3073638 RepID=UPI00288AB4AE|nr:DoxX family membrane protein [Sphingobium sp. WCS2017Hpa-17]